MFDDVVFCPKEKKLNEKYAERNSREVETYNFWIYSLTSLFFVRIWFVCMLYNNKMRTTNESSMTSNGYDADELTKAKGEECTNLWNLLDDWIETWERRECDSNSDIWGKWEKILRSFSSDVNMWEFWTRGNNFIAFFVVFLRWQSSVNK